MGFFSNANKDTEQAVTNSSLAIKFQKALDQSAKELDTEREQALFNFRQTVNSLVVVNEMLRQDVAVAEEMIKACQNRKLEAEQQIKDNEAICDHILEIIGEPIKQEQENLQ